MIERVQRGRPSTLRGLNKGAPFGRSSSAICRTTSMNPAVYPRSLGGRNHPAAPALPSIDQVHRQACIGPAMRAFRLIC